MHTCISSHRLKRSWHSCPRRVNAGNKNTPSMHHPWRRNVTTLMVGLKNGHIRKKSHPKMVNPRDIAGERRRRRRNVVRLLFFYFQWLFECIHILFNSTRTGHWPTVQPVCLLQCGCLYACLCMHKSVHACTVYVYTSLVHVCVYRCVCMSMYVCVPVYEQTCAQAYSETNTAQITFAHSCIWTYLLRGILSLPSMKQIICMIMKHCIAHDPVEQWAW